MKASTLQSKLEELAKAKKEAIDAGNIEKAAMIRDIEKEVMKELEGVKKNTAK
jgi:protein-arginine kinase activator protein McsA